MSAHAEAAATHEVGSAKLFLQVWAWLLGLTAIEVLLAYLRLHPSLMLTILVGLSLIKYALIISYFMHLRFERLGLFFLIIPALVFCICVMLVVFFPDARRLVEMRPQW